MEYIRELLFQVSCIANLFKMVSLNKKHIAAKSNQLPAGIFLQISCGRKVLKGLIFGNFEYLEISENINPKIDV